LPASLSRLIAAGYLPKKVTNNAIFCQNNGYHRLEQQAGLTIKQKKAVVINLLPLLKKIRRDY
jgi:hypothetical protein